MELTEVSIYSRCDFTNSRVSSGRSRHDESAEVETQDRRADRIDSFMGTLLTLAVVASVVPEYLGQFIAAWLSASNRQPQE
jgi:hypothetical protein